MQNIHDEIEQRTLWLGFHWENNDSSIDDMAVEHSWWRHLTIVPNLRKDVGIALKFLLDAIDDLMGVTVRVLGNSASGIEDLLIEKTRELYDLIFKSVKFPLWLRPLCNLTHRFVKTAVIPVLINYFVYKINKGKFIV